MRRAISIAIVVASLLATGSASASLWDNVFRGLDLIATPSGSPITTTGDGTRVNGARNGRVRIVPNGVIGKGYRLEFDRSFGVDSSGRPETFRFAGLGEMTLSGNTQFTAGFTRPKKGLYFGDMNFVANNLSYDIRTRLGAQDAALSGTLNAVGTLNANVFGFYDLTLNVSNTNSQFTVDGVAANDETNTNFDIGPVSLKGNLYVDLLSGGLANAGLAALDLESLFDRSPIAFSNDAIAEGLQESAADDNLDDRSRVASLMLRTVLGQDQAAASELMESLVASDGALLSSLDESSAPATQAIPESGTLTLLIAGGALLSARRRR